MPGTTPRGSVAARQAWRGPRPAATALLAAVALTAAACGSSGGSSGGPSGNSGGTGGKTTSVVATYPGVTQDTALHNALPAQYRSNGVKVAVFNDWPPDEFLQNNQLTGWSVDLAHAMAAVLNVKFSYTPTSFDAVLPGIQNGRFNAGSLRSESPRSGSRC